MLTIGLCVYNVRLAVDFLLYVKSLLSNLLIIMLIVIFCFKQTAEVLFDCKFRPIFMIYLTNSIFSFIGL